MANMSYCQFENTERDLRACLEDLCNADENGKTYQQYRKSLSKSEKEALDSLFLLCANFVEQVQDWDEDGRDAEGNLR